MARLLSEHVNQLAQMAAAFDKQEVNGTLAISRLAGAVAAAVVLLIAVPAAAQDSRESQIEAQQAEKAMQLQPTTPDRLEQRLLKLDGLLSSQRRLYPFFGSVFEGSGFAVGPGFRTHFADKGLFTAHAAWSVRSARALKASVTVPVLSDRVTMGARADWLNAPRVSFYGVGNDTSSDDRTTFAYRTKTIGAFARTEITSSFAVGAGVDWLSAEAGNTTGLTLAPTYARSNVFAEFDTRPSPDYARRGGLYRVEWSNYHQTNSGFSSFRRVDAEARQFIPFLRENWVIALRALASTTTTDSLNEVPYFLMPSLGGSHTLRGYSSWRFRDRNRLLFSGEYRWTAGSFVDMALFLDAGKVAPRWSDFGRSSFTKSYGVGLTLHTLTTALARIEVARTGEGTALLLSFGPSF